MLIIIIIKLVFLFYKEMNKCIIMFNKKLKKAII